MERPIATDIPPQLDDLLSAAAQWRGTWVCLSWAHERRNHADGAAVAEAESLVAQVKSVKVSGRRDGGGEWAVHRVQLELDCGLYFGAGRIESLTLNQDGASGTVVYRSVAGMALSASKAVTIRRMP